MATLELIKTPRATGISLDQLTKGWTYDPYTLDAFFEICIRNWKEWSGRKPAKVVPQVNGTFLQATQGDYVDQSDKSPEAAMRDQTPSYQEWKRLIGIDQETAKRRFITLLRSIDKRLLNVKSKPVGYVLTTREGEPICPWANTARGCPLPLLDLDGTSLVDVVSRDMELLKKESYFRRWIFSHEKHSCRLGVHMPLIPLVVRPYLPWFKQKICGGFKPYNFVAYRDMVRDIVDKQAAHFQDMMDHSKKYKYIDVERELDALIVMIKVYKDYTKLDYTYETLCQRTDHHCNQRRVTDRGINHKHPIILSLANGNFSTEAYDKIVEVREEARRVGLSAVTGVMRDPENRFRILRDRLLNFQRQRAAAEAARQRLEDSKRKHEVLTLIPAQAAVLMDEKLANAIRETKMDAVARGMHLGANKNAETPSGITGLIRAVMLSDVKLVKKMVKEVGCDVNYCTSQGMTALSWACKLGDPVMVETLMDMGADAAMEGVGNMTPFMVAVRHYQPDIIETILDHIFRDGKSGSRGLDRVLNYQTKDGTTALMLAAQHRMFGMVRLLLRKNANKTLRNLAGQTADALAKRAGWTVIMEFLQTTRAIGPTGTYTANDDQSEKEIKEATMILMETLRVNGSDLSGTGKLDKGMPLPIKLLRTNNVSPDLETTDGSTCLICASYSRDLKLVRSLLQEGCSVNYQNRLGKTALMAAASTGSYEVALELLSRGADPFHLDVESRSCVLYAEEAGHELMTKFLCAVQKDGLQPAVAFRAELLRREEAQKALDKQMAVLEKYGMTKRAKAEQDLFSWKWRIAPPNIRLRCWKCTAYVPCQHFASKAELKKSADLVESCWRWHYQPRGWRRKRRREKELEPQADGSGEGGDAALPPGLVPIVLPVKSTSPQPSGPSTPTKPPPATMPGGVAQAAQAGAKAASAAEAGARPSIPERPSTPSPLTESPAKTDGDRNQASPARNSRQRPSSTPTNPRASISMSAMVDAARVRKSSEEPLEEDSRPLRIQYANVRALLGPRRRKLDYRAVGKSDFLFRMGKCDAHVADILSHGTTDADYYKMVAEDGKIWDLRSVLRRGVGMGFASVDVRYSVCVFPKCSRCTIGFAKVLCPETRCALCDVCILIRVANLKEPFDTSNIAAYEPVTPLPPKEACDSLPAVLREKPVEPKVPVVEKKPARRRKRNSILGKLLTTEGLRPPSEEERQRAALRRSSAVGGQQAMVYHRSKNLDLADFLLARHKADEAEGLLLKTLDDHLRVYGPMHVSIALIMRSMGHMEDIRGFTCLARAYREVSFEIMMTIFGPINTETTRSANLLARTMVAQGGYDDAKFFYEQIASQLNRSHLGRYKDLADLLLEGRDKAQRAQEEAAAAQRAQEEAAAAAQRAQEEAAAAAAQSVKGSPKRVTRR
jgi:ankyrin repeat protein/acyl-CoA-binding protein